MRFGIDPIRPGDARDADVVNAQVTLLTTPAWAPDNFAEDGLPGRAFAGYSRAGLVERISQTTRPGATYAPTAWATFAFSGTTFRTAGITLAAEEVLEVTSRVELTSIAATNQGLSLDARFGTRIAYRESATVTPKLGSTRRRTPGLAVKGNHARLKSTALIFGPLELDWVELQAELVLGGVGTACFPKSGQLVVMRYRRTS